MHTAELSFRVMSKSFNFITPALKLVLAALWPTSAIIRGKIEELMLTSQYKDYTAFSQLIFHRFTITPLIAFL